MMEMNMVEPNSLGGLLDGVPAPGDKGFPEDGPVDILDFLDFPMESLEDDDTGGVVDWDVSKSHCLGPIPTDALLGLPPFPSDNNTNGNTFPRTRMPPQPNAHVGGTGETQESGSFQIHSPVSVLDSSGSCSGGKGLSIKSDIVIPVRTRSKRARPSNLNPWFVIPPISSARKMIRSRKTKEKRKRVSTISSMQNADYSFHYTEEDVFNASDATLETREGSQQSSGPVKKCTHCEVTKTPQWREGPMGPKTLCNACGVRYRSGRLFPEYRPAASPTFVPTIHSNSHKKVIEMRQKGMPETATLRDVPVSPPPEFVPVKWNSSPFDLIYGDDSHISS